MDNEGLLFRWHTVIILHFCSQIPSKGKPKINIFYPLQHYLRPPPNHKRMLEICIHPLKTCKSDTQSQYPLYTLLCLVLFMCCLGFKCQVGKRSPILLNSVSGVYRNFTFNTIGKEHTEMHHEESSSNHSILGFFVFCFFC